MGPLASHCGLVTICGLAPNSEEAAHFHNDVPLSLGVLLDIQKVFHISDSHAGLLQTGKEQASVAEPEAEAHTGVGSLRVLVPSSAPPSLPHRGMVEAKLEEAQWERVRGEAQDLSSSCSSELGLQGEHGVTAVGLPFPASLRAHLPKFEESLSLSPSFRFFFLSF